MKAGPLRGRSKRNGHNWPTVAGVGHRVNSKEG